MMVDDKLVTWFCTQLTPTLGPDLFGEAEVLHAFRLLETQTRTAREGSDGAVSRQQVNEQKEARPKRPNWLRLVGCGWLVGWLASWLVG